LSLLKKLLQVARVIPPPLLNPARSAYYAGYRIGIRLWCGFENLSDWWGRGPNGLERMPPAWLRYCVSGSPLIRTFLETGEKCSHAIEDVLSQAGKPLTSCESILDFGCGCGRTLVWLERRFPGGKYYGTDVDHQAIHWCRQNLPFGRFSTNDAIPPLNYPDEAFDLIYGISVLTHLDEQHQFRWLQELGRLIKQDGVVLLTVHGLRAAEVVGQRENLEKNGYCFCSSTKLKGIFPDWYQTALHTEEYVRERFGKYFARIGYYPEQLGFQDMILVRK